MLKMSFKIGFLSALLLALVIPHADAKIPDIVVRQRSAVVTVYVDDRSGKHIDSGTGFIVDRHGIIVADCRVIGKWIAEAGAALSVAIKGKGLFPVEEVLSSKCENNLALLKIKATDLPTVEVSGDFRPRQGEDIVILKVRPEPDTAASACTIRSVSAKGGSFQISVQAKQEDSGSPLFNMKGVVIGAVIAQTERGKRLNFAVPMKEIGKQLARYKLSRNSIESDVRQPGTDKAPEIKTDDIYDYFSRGCAYDRLSMYRDAIEAYRESLKINPGFVETYVNLGLDYYRIGKYDDAVDIFKQALRIKPELVSVYTKLGATHIIKGEYSDAVDILKKAIDIDPGNSSAHFNLGVAYFLSGDTAAARKECTLLKDIDKGKADSLTDLVD
jgi:Tfp pilus assembly protein PilF